MKAFLPSFTLLLKIKFRISINLMRSGNEASKDPTQWQFCLHFSYKNPSPLGTKPLALSLLHTPLYKINMYTCPFFFIVV